MADVLIRGMEMPTHCDDCTFYDGIFCARTGYYIYYPEEKLEECPLIEVPDHGDLIDQDKYRDEFMNGVYALCSDDSDNYRANAIIDLFDEAPTVIPAEPPKEET